jgi:hypothetical protein
MFFSCFRSPTGWRSKTESLRLGDRLRRQVIVRGEFREKVTNQFDSLRSLSNLIMSRIVDS